jgi:hypothetical protein
LLDKGLKKTKQETAAAMQRRGKHACTTIELLLDVFYTVRAEELS